MNELIMNLYSLVNYGYINNDELLINSKCSLSVENTVYSISNLTIYYFIALSQCIYNNDSIVKSITCRYFTF